MVYDGFKVYNLTLDTARTFNNARPAMDGFFFDIL